MNKLKVVSKFLTHTRVLFVLVLFALSGAVLLAQNPDSFRAHGFGFGQQVLPDGLTTTGLGFVSFGCSDDEPLLYGGCEQTDYYGVDLNANSDDSDYGKLTGHAFSSIYGYISFNYSDVSSCGPQAEVEGDFTEFLASDSGEIALSGWAKVLLADQTSAGWSGCMYLGDMVNVSGNAPADSAGFAPSITLEGETMILNGWAWADIGTYGWMVMNPDDCVVLDDTLDCSNISGVQFDDIVFGPNVWNFQGEPNPVAVGETTTLSWQVNSEVNSCQTSIVGDIGFSNDPIQWGGPAQGPGPATYSLDITGMSATTTFQIDCSNADGTITDTETLTIVVEEPEGSFPVLTVDAGPLNVVVNQYLLGEDNNVSEDLTYGLLQNGDLPGTIDSCVLTAGPSNFNGEFDNPPFLDNLNSDTSKTHSVDYIPYIDLLDDQGDWSANGAISKTVNYTYTCQFNFEGGSQEISASDSITLLKTATAPSVELFGQPQDSDLFGGYVGLLDINPEDGASDTWVNVTWETNEFVSECTASLYTPDISFPDGTIVNSIGSLWSGPQDIDGGTLQIPAGAVTGPNFLRIDCAGLTEFGAGTAFDTLQISLGECAYDCTDEEGVPIFEEF